MSGIEIAGLVLGAIPLVIAALEHYEEFVEPTMVFTDFHNELMRAVSTLTTQQVLFRQSLEFILQPITTDKQLVDMLEYTKSKEWQNPEIQSKLETSLGRAYPAWMRTVSEIQRIMIRIASKLENVPGVKTLERDGLEAIIRSNAAAMKGGQFQRLRFSRRIKFTMSRKSIKRSMKDLRGCLADLAALQDNASQLANVENSHFRNPRYHYSQSIDTVRQDTVRLFEGLSKAWCSLHTSHEMALLLERRRASKRKNGLPAIGDASGTCFDLTIRMVPTPTPQNWKAVEVWMLEVHNQSIEPRSKACPSLPSPPVPRPTSTRPSVISHNGNQLQVVKNICRVLKSSCQSSIGMCIDSDGYLRGAYDTNRCSSLLERETRLGDLLRNREKFTRKERYTLAITLVSSLLQLSSTPWMTEGWDKERILFHRIKACSAISDKQVTATCRADIESPYLSFEHASQSHESDGLVKPAAVDSSKLLALGVMLIEICEKKPFESLYKPSDVGLDETQAEFFHLLAGRKWLDTRVGSGKINGAFVRAISHCLQSYLDPGASIANPDFVKSVEENVLESLEEEMYLLFEKK